MTKAEEVIESPIAWVADHIRDYVATEGQKGQQWMGVDTLLLTTRGRKSGKRHRTALICGRDGDRFVIVASKGGFPTHPIVVSEPRSGPDGRGASGRGQVQRAQSLPRQKRNFGFAG